ncbi:substrate-binding periplasmic protein [Thalassotalea euphylliae]|uniref:substrate-binding periplasmic protein n=1 Tax=Thalassotalea euphylliae TaxID=1655234 RepID=UPI0036261CB5
MKYVFCVLAIFIAFPAASERLNVGVFDEHAMYLKTSKPYQVGWQVLNRAANKAGLEIVPVEEAWARSIQELKKGNLDGVFGAMRSAEREQWAEFSLPLSNDAVHVFTHKSNSVNNLREIDLKAATVGVSKDSVQHKMAIELGFNNVYAIIDRNALYKMLVANRIDYLIFSDTFTHIYCHKYSEDANHHCLKPLEPALASNSMHLMYNANSNTRHEAFARLDEVLVEMKKSGEIKAIFKQIYQDNSHYNVWAAFFDN